MRVISQLNETSDKLSSDVCAVYSSKQERTLPVQATMERRTNFTKSLFSLTLLCGSGTVTDTKCNLLEFTRCSSLAHAAASLTFSTLFPSPQFAIRRCSWSANCMIDGIDEPASTSIPNHKVLEKEPFPLTSVIISVTSLVQDEVSVEQPNPLYDLTDERENAAILEFVVREYKRLDANREGSERWLANQRAVRQQAAAEMAAATNPMREDVQRAEGARRATRIVLG
jgi:hypothetical protein